MESIYKLTGTFDKKLAEAEKPTVSKAVIKRLPRYHRYLGELIRTGTMRISSAELSRLMNVTASQIRQDFNCFGGFGQQGYGYNVKYLYDKISDLLGVNEGYSAVIVGAGNLGKALAATRMFDRRGISRAAMFDVDESVVGTEICGIPVYHVDTLGSFCRENDVKIGVLCVPKEVAYEVSVTMADNGVVGIWNFANMELKLDNPEVIVENIHLGDSLMKLGYEIKTMIEKRDNQ